MRITYDDIEFGLFKRGGGNDAIAFTRVILTESRNALGYLWQRSIHGLGLSIRIGYAFFVFCDVLVLFCIL